MRSLVLVVALCALAAGCGGGSSEQSATPAPAAGAPSGRERAPAIAGTSLDGEAVSLADYRGRAVLINVWSSW